MDAEVKELREEIARLRERVAVLEARPQRYAPLTFGPQRSGSPLQYPPDWDVATPMKMYGDAKGNN